MGKVRDDETLGRACFDSHRRTKPNQGYFRRSLRRHKGKLSVDRFAGDLSNIDYLTQVHDLEATRYDSKMFFGWHCFGAEAIRRKKGVVICPSPRDGADDGWHADIIPSTEDQAETVLAVIVSEMVWCERPA